MLCIAGFDDDSYMDFADGFVSSNSLVTFANCISSISLDMKTKFMIDISLLGVRCSL